MDFSVLERIVNRPIGWEGPRVGVDASYNMNNDSNIEEEIIPTKKFFRTALLMVASLSLLQIGLRLGNDGLQLAKFVTQDQSKLPLVESILKGQDNN